MDRYRYRLLLFAVIILSVSCPVIHGSVSWFPYHYVQQANRRFEQKTDRFWEYDEQAKRWVEVELPRDLVSCVDGNCSKLGLIGPGTRRGEEDRGGKNDGGGERRESSDVALTQRKRISLTKMSETSIWVTGESGSIYERFWNGVQWVIAPHDLPIAAGPAKSVFFVNQTILALSEAGQLYQIQLIDESSQPLWVEFPPIIDLSSSKEKDESAAIQIKSGVVSHDGVKVYFCTKKGLLLELSEVEPPRWVNHGRPPGANVVEIADAANLRPEVIFTISSTGELYEFDPSSRPSWKKHISGEGRAEDTSLMPSRGCALPGLNGDNSMSLFLLTKGGNLIERRLHQQKWRWIVYESPKDQNLSSIASVQQDESVENFYSLFFTTTTGDILEYRKPKHSEMSDNHILENWVNHMHPDQARAACGIAGTQFQSGRMMFPLDDGRLGELHLSGFGGETSGPGQVNIRKKPSMKYMWSILEAPETEGWNAEYCSEERGPTNCINGIKDDNTDSSGHSRTVIRRRKASQMQQEYLFPGTSGSGGTEYSLPSDWTNNNFRLRVMYGGRSFFVITDGGLTFEYIYTENIWFWLRHDHSTAVKGAVGNYNGSLFVVDTYGSLFMRERSSDTLNWINCTAMRKGKRVIGGPPWDGIPGRDVMLTVQDSLFLVSNNGKLLQFIVSHRKFKWKDCKNPMSTKIGSIIDQEQFRKNIVFVVGRNGRLYQYNKVTELWHEHSQSHHLVLSRLPGTAMRPVPASLAGSVFMLSEDGGLVEYRWNTVDGWSWVEHGTPKIGVTLVGSTGPCFQESQLFLIGSDGAVYLRYMDQTMWKWENLGYPLPAVFGDETQAEAKQGKDDICMNEDFNAAAKRKAINCDPKVAPTRPIPFSEDSVIFELRDGRLAEMRKAEDAKWVWSRTIGTPTSLCQENYWAALEA
ncbi:uncharacterized protein LOC116201097 isoform X2 [Punica granatum]|uniref:Uncharacterized protein LOC116201097 isoform X2 n=1 Tax=Punica granatum TaxID=22663 RepID=A0A6P8DA34_PUNGR|nr:uncharacterized protein LOC116201097 isoform X2 [Punica granatum]